MLMSKKMPRALPSLAAFVLFVAMLCGVAMQSHASKSDLMSVNAEKEGDPTIFLTLGMAEVIDVGGPIADLMIADPSIVDVSLLQSNRLYLVGVTLGTTNLIAADEAGNVIKRL